MVESQCLLEPEKVGEAGGMLLVSCDLALHMGYGIMSRQRSLRLCTTHMEDIFCSMICEYVIVDSLPLSKSWTWLLSAFSAPPFLPSTELAIESMRSTGRCHGNSAVSQQIRARATEMGGAGGAWDESDWFGRLA